MQSLGMRADCIIRAPASSIGRSLTLGRLAVPTEVRPYRQHRNVRSRKPARCEKRRNVLGRLIVQSVASSGSGSQGLNRVEGKPTSLLRSIHDRDIVNLAVPALFSILLDPIMSLTDTGEAVYPSSHYPRSMIISHLVF